jgi:DNA polymerase
MLEASGTPVPYKPSPKHPDKLIPALAKNDEGMVALLDHEDPVIAALAAARVGVKSTQLETRMQSFLRVGELMGGFMPIALNYYGAENTGRWSGSMGLNQQNLPRVGKKPRLHDALRKCLRAPPGHVVVVADLSGIELRMNHFLWKVPSSMALFRADPAEADLYREFAAKLYRKAPEEVTKDERQVGKVAQLGLGYGAGAATYQTIARVMGGVRLTLEEAQDVVDAWRASYPEIVAAWRRSHRLLQSIAVGHKEITFDQWGLCKTAEGGIRTPTGFIHYHNLRQDEEEWVYGPEKRPTRIYAGKIVENIVQHLSREAMADMMLSVSKKYHVVHTVHDELVLVVKESKAQEALDYMQQVMRAGVKWFPELITWSSGSFGESYGDAK